MEAVISIGCEGRQDSGFVFCRGAENIILDLDKHKYSENYSQLLEYIEKVAKLYEGPCCKQNVVMNALYKFYQLDYLSELQYKYISYFTQMHKMCGIILKVKVKNEQLDVKI